MDLLNLVGTLTLDASGYYSALGNADSKAVSFANKVNGKIDSVKKGFLIGTGAMVAGVTAFAGASIKTGAEFDKSMSQVVATMGYTAEELNTSGSEAQKTYEDLRKTARELGETTIFSAKEASEGLNYMALAGYDAQTSIEMLPQVLNLASAGAMDLGRASDIVTDIQSALGLSIRDTSELIDQMAKTSSKTNTNVEQLGEAFLNVGGTAKIMKGGTVEASASLGVLASAGIKGSQGGIALRNILNSISGSKFEKSFKALGVEAYDAEGKMRALPDILSDMNNVMGGMTDKEKQNILSKVFNVRDLKSINALLMETPKQWDELTESIRDSEGATEEIAKVKTDNLAGDISRLKSAFEEMQIKVSDNLTPAFRKFVQFVTKLINNFDILAPIVLGVATAFGVFAVAINLTAIIEAVTTAMGALSAVLIANPIGIVVALLAGLAVALMTAWRTSETFREKVSEVFENVKQSISDRIDFIVKVFTTLKSKVSSAFNAVKNVVSTVANAIKTAVTRIFGNMVHAMTHPIDHAKGVIKNTLNGIKKIFNALDLKLPHIDLPHFKVTGKWDLKKLQTPKLDVQWYKKANEQPYMFGSATLFGAGEAGDEILYGKSSLMDDITTAVQKTAQNGSHEVTIVNNITVEDGKDPKQFIDEFIRRLKIEMRTV